MIPTDLRAAFFRPTWHRFTASVDVPPFGVMRVTSATEEDGELVYTCAKPDTTFRRFYVVNGPFYVASGKEGICSTLMQGGYVQYSSGTPSVGSVWGPKNNQWGLEQYYYGFEITGGTKTVAGVTVVSAVQTGVAMVKGKTDSAHSKGNTGTVSLYDTNGSDTTTNITGVLNSFADVATTKWVAVGWMGDVPNLIAAEC